MLKEVYSQRLVLQCWSISLAIVSHNGWSKQPIYTGLSVDSILEIWCNIYIWHKHFHNFAHYVSVYFSITLKTSPTVVSWKYVSRISINNLTFHICCLQHRTSKYLIVIFKTTSHYALRGLLARDFHVRLYSNIHGTPIMILNSCWNRDEPRLPACKANMLTTAGMVPKM